MNEPSKNTSENPQSLEGTVFNPNNPEEMAQAIHTAFDYRGDVTLTLQDGQQAEGYLYNHDAEHVHLFSKKDPKTSTPQAIPISQIAQISFTGQDPAFGKSWEDWQTKSTAQKQAEVERQKQKAKEEGLL